MRRESVQSSSKQLLDDINAASPDLLEAYPMRHMSIIDTLNNAAPSVASDVSDGVEIAALPPKPHLLFIDNKRLEESSSSVTGKPQTLPKVVPNFSRQALFPPSLLHSWPRSDAEDTWQTPILEDSHPSSAALAASVNVKKMFSEHISAFEAAIPQAEAPRLCKVLLFGSGAVGKSPLVLQVCSGRENSSHSTNLQTKSLSPHILMRTTSMTQRLKTNTGNGVWLTRSSSIWILPISPGSWNIQSYGNNTFVPVIVSCLYIVSHRAVRSKRFARSRSTFSASDMKSTFPLS